MSTDRYELKEGGAISLDRSVTRLLYVSSAKYGGDWHSLMHTHACTEIFYVAGGAGQFRIEELTLPVGADDMIIVNPNVEHTEVGLDQMPLEYVVVGVEGLELVSRELGDQRYCLMNFQGSREEVLHILRTLLHEIQNKAPGYGIICQDLLEVLVLRLMRRTDFSLRPAARTQKRASKECAAVRRYIDGHFKEDITLDLLARIAHVNKYYLVHSFSGEYGVSPINYLVSRRVEESCYLLSDTDHSLSQISHMLGFSSPSYFSQSFRRLRGMSPMEYRKRSKAAS